MSEYQWRGQMATVAPAVSHSELAGTLAVTYTFQPGQPSPCRAQINVGLPIVVATQELHPQLVSVNTTIAGKWLTADWGQVTASRAGGPPDQRVASMFLTSSTWDELAAMVDAQSSLILDLLVQVRQHNLKMLATQPPATVKVFVLV